MCLWFYMNLSIKWVIFESKTLKHLLLTACKVDTRGIFSERRHFDNLNNVMFCLVKLSYNGYSKTVFDK